MARDFFSFVTEMFPARLRRSPRLRGPSQRALRQSAACRKRMSERAQQANELAGRMQSPRDASRLVGMLLPHTNRSLRFAWAMRGIRERIARAEYQAATSPGALIPEQRVADAWNGWLANIGAPPETLITAAEIRILRDGRSVSAQRMWARGNRSIWTVWKIYAVGQDDRVAEGCRALEAIHILWNLARYPEEISWARDLIRKGQRMSDLYRNPLEPPKPGTERCFVSCRAAPPNPTRMAAERYRREHGSAAFYRALRELAQALFPG